jgi:hypothetical protein
MKLDGDIAFLLALVAGLLVVGLAFVAQSRSVSVTESGSGSVGY